MMFLAVAGWASTVAAFRGTKHEQSVMSAAESGGIVEHVTSKVNPWINLYKIMLKDAGALLSDPRFHDHIKGWHINYGTLIGCKRDGNTFLPWDNDIDISVAGQPWDDQAFFNTFKAAVESLPGKDYTFTKESWMEEAKGNLFRISKGSRKPDGTLDVPRKARGPNGEGSWIDLYQYYSCSSGKCIVLGQPGDGMMEMAKIFPTQTCTIASLEAQCPKEPAYVLTNLYGPKYMESDMAWCDTEWLPIKDGKSPCAVSVRAGTLALVSPKDAPKPNAPPAMDALKPGASPAKDAPKPNAPPAMDAKPGASPAKDAPNPPADPAEIN